MASETSVQAASRTIRPKPTWLLLNVTEVTVAVAERTKSWAIGTGWK